MGEAGWDPADIPALMRAARGSYGKAISADLVASGYEDLPRNGPFVLGGMANQGGSAVDMIRGLGVSRQAASQLIDTLVVRGYLARETNNDDRRRLDIMLTERGRGAAAVVRGAVERVHAELVTMISARDLAGLRAGLTALASIKHGDHDGGK
ncbi:MAG TPA: MarR family transcriptional regulator [Pseudonocardiaceae bacterium]|nr:MarR family transcriptional regulator [Pseudonocardiaceae bacterium]